MSVIDPGIDVARSAEPVERMENSVVELGPSDFVGGVSAGDRVKGVR